MKSCPLTAKGESTAETGTITADKTITTKMLVSAQGKEKKDVTLKPATTGAYAGTYAGRENHEHGDVHDGGREPGAG